jgi:predicted DNA-binding transcriptional regulator YafY
MTSTRLLLLLSLLQTRRDWPGQTLADRLDISPRTVRRDVDRLREMGYRITAVMGPDGGYRLDSGSELPPLLFDDDQAIAIGVALQAATGMGAGIEEAAVRALTTVRQVMPSRLRHRLDALDVTPLRTDGADAVSTDVLVALAAAVHAHEVLRFDYLGDPDNRPPRRVEPHHLVTSDGRWYLVGWDLEREDWRIFRADRMTPRGPTGRRFTPREVPVGDVRTFVSGRFKGSVAGDVWPCRGRVIVHLPLPAVAPFVGDGSVEAVDDSRCLIESGSWSWIALAASFGRFDAPIEVVEPPELADAFATLAARYADAAR